MELDQSTPPPTILNIAKEPHPHKRCCADAANQGGLTADATGALGHEGGIKMVEGDLAWEQQHLEGKRRYDDLIKHDGTRNQEAVPVHCCWIRQDGIKQNDTAVVRR